ncbi:response regulator [Parvularcula sp. ZS-1/3]|uniref:Response regulator n=1 Tax=Parvularcula mediterranea TaxID=2732508 RepID=A0A7Y3RP36_9PROT|nr:response regulator [Parvularcula mediterranea]NNU17560.1 response regulator [Parvularcula mediterranea]
MKLALRNHCPSTRVFVVEDDDAVREGMRTLLEGEGYQVSCYATALDFLSDAAPTDNDVVVLDIGLPDLLGDAVVAFLKKSGFQPRIIVVSGLKLGPFEAAVRCIAPEAAYRKPLNLRALLRQLGTVQPYGAPRT